MLFKLSLSNIKKSIKDYAIYFMTLIFGVAIFYIFNAIETQSAMLSVSADTREIIRLLTTILSAVSVYIAFVLGFLVIYASRFLMKRRNKEFGLYLVLGMGKRKVSLILFFETLLIGIISLAVGLVIGIGVSQLTSVFVASMFAADMSKYHFVFSPDAGIKTMIYFAMIYLVVILFNTFSINKCKLIDLFQGSRKSETVKMKKPWICILVFLFAACLLGFAYYHVTAGYENMNGMRALVVYILMGCIGTFLVFWSLSGLLLKIISSMKGIYYKGLNAFTFRQLSSRVNTNVISMTIICLMLFITICVLGSGLTVRNSLVSNLKELAPADIHISHRNTVVKDYGDKKKQKAEKDISIFALYKKWGCDLESYFKEYVDFYVYTAEDFTWESTFGSVLSIAKEKYPYIMYDSKADIMKLSDYNKVAKIYGKETFSLDENEYLVVADFGSMVELRNLALEKGETISAFGQELTPKYKECKDGFVEMSGNKSNLGIFVVPDSVVEEDCKVREYVIANYNTTSKTEIEEIEKKVTELIEKHEKGYSMTAVTTKNMVAASSIGLGAIICFIGLYVGLIFLISGAAMLALKELSESADNLERFRLLRKLGVEDRLMNRALLKQTGLFFGFPLILAIVHSVFGMLFSAKILEVIGINEMLPSMIMTVVILVVIYGGYFVVTYLSSKNMITIQNQ